MRLIRYTIQGVDVVGIEAVEEQHSHAGKFNPHPGGDISRAPIYHRRIGQK